MKDYYKILGVEENATEEQIKKQYRILSKQYHPDVNPQGDEKFKEIAEAYDFIGNPTKRAEYDAKRKNPFASGNMDSFFHEFFNQNPFQGRQQRKNAPDKVIKVEITPIESYLGSEKTITYLRNVGCDSCKGSGGDRQTCVTCNGAGFQVRTFGTGFLVQQVRSHCETCGGKGYTLIHKCLFCDGRGVKSLGNEIRITIPHGIDNGQYLKLENLGDYSNGHFGDLVIQVVLTKNEFEKINNDLIYNLILGYNDLLKETYLIPHPDGDLKVNAPKNFDTIKPLRIRSKGYNGGDFYVKLNVKFDRELVQQ